MDTMGVGIPNYYKRINNPKMQVGTSDSRTANIKGASHSFLELPSLTQTLTQKFRKLGVYGTLGGVS